MLLCEPSEEGIMGASELREERLDRVYGARSADELT
jgi:hypothetical protein